MQLKKEVICPAELPPAPDNMTGLPITFIEEILVGCVFMFAGLSYFYMWITSPF